MSQLHGIDVSNNNGSASVDAALANNSIAFVLLKASEGEHTADKTHDSYTAKARAKKKLIGHYHFGHPTQNATAEADFFLSRAKAKPGDVLALDLEAAEGTASQRLAYALAFMARVHAKTGARPLFYSYTSYVAGMLKVATAAQQAQLLSYPLWMADPSMAAGHPRLEGFPQWAIHQYAITRGLDQNILNGDGALWARLAIPVPHAPVPPKSTPVVKPPAKVTVHLSHLLAARRKDIPAKTGHTTYKAEVLEVEQALHAEGLLAAQYVDGSWGTKTDAAYDAFRRKVGYKGNDATGAPGLESLRKLAARHGFPAAA